MKRDLPLNFSRLSSAAGFIFLAMFVSGCVAYVPPHHAAVVYTPPVYAYQTQPAYSPAPMVGTEPAPGGPSAAALTTEANVHAQTAPQETTQLSSRLVIVSQPPPAPQTEIVPVPPGPDYAWTPGYWSWNGGGWVWICGRWLIRPRYGAIWISGHWVRHGRNWVWIGGQWH